MKSKNEGKFNDEELAEAHIISEDLDPAEHIEMLKQFGIIKAAMVNNLTPEQKKLSKMLQLRFQQEDDLKGKITKG